MVNSAFTGCARIVALCHTSWVNIYWVCLSFSFLYSFYFLHSFFISFILSFFCSLFFLSFTLLIIDMFFFHPHFIYFSIFYLSIYIYIYIYQYRSIVANLLDCDITISEFKTLVIQLLVNTFGKYGGARSVMAIVVGNGHGDTSSNPGREWLHFT